MTAHFTRSAIVTGFVCLFVSAAPLFAQQNGTLKVKTSSNRTGVFVDGKYLGPAANFKITRKYSLSAGQHELILREPRFEEYKTTIRIDAGKTTTVSQQLTARPLVTPPFGTLKVRGFEKYSAVYLNGAYVGHADEFDLLGQGLLVKPDEYEIEVTSPAGASVLKSKVTIQADKVEIVHR